MRIRQSCGALFLALLGSLSNMVPAFAEFQCAPAGSPPLLTTDAFFAETVAAWSRTTARRPTEGEQGNSCNQVAVPGYEGFPTQRCTYEDADAGKDVFPPLRAEIIVLNPSAKQLAAWSISACRTNGAVDSAMPKCLQSLRSHIVSSNGAQFAVAGSVIESYCNSSTKYGECKDLPKNSQWLRPRHTWFRDGVSVDFQARREVKWDHKKYGTATFDFILDVAKSDSDLNKTYTVARIGAARREQWRDWRRHLDKPEMLNGAPGTVDGAGWRKVAADVHRAACRGAANELFDAVVFANKKWTTP